ncbi:MAG: hypothetical protein HKP36_17820 [Myxococcales bacterium]|nr:hypothetical protein [Deltaproteobacteria bacterium]NNK43372.1 hypothetical protein [Myxococcales bacterium]NNL26295.1 hypothetical protein [Myxococcales bacterium]RZV52049.1 MAG: hypothetical protein EX268_13010 [Deltaproteobacteria bacterium]
MAAKSVTSLERDVIDEARGLREQVLNMSLLIAVVVGGAAFVRTVIDSVDRGAWMVLAGAVAMYAGALVLLLMKRLPYAVRALGFLALLWIVGVLALLAVGYLGAPILILAGQSVLASVLFGRRVTLIALGLNLIALLVVGAALSTGLTTVETLAFYEPTVFMNWLRITAIFAVFCGIAVVSVDVITNHLNQSLKDQAELIENLRGAMQLRDAAETQRRNAEKRLRESQQMPKV